MESQEKKDIRSNVPELGVTESKVGSVNTIRVDSSHKI